MTAVRPPVFPPNRLAPAGPQRADPAKLAAQKAFFDAALGKAAAPSATQAARAAAAAQPAAPVAGAADKPARPLRPGSLLDIRV